MAEDWDLLSAKEQWTLENDLKNRWRSARDRFRKDFSAKEKSGASPPARRKYAHFDELLFFGTNPRFATVQERPLLWDPKQPNYSVRQLRDDAWEDICKTMAEDWDLLSAKEQWTLENDLKNRWRSARDRFRKDFSAKEKSGASPPARQKYAHFDELLFLVPTRDLRPTGGNVANEPRQNSAECEDEPHNPAGEGTSTLNAAALQDESSEPLLLDSSSPLELPSASGQNPSSNVRTQNRSASRRLLVQKSLESEAASLLRRVGSKDLYDGFGDTVAGQCLNLPVERRCSFMSFVLAVADIYSVTNSPPVVESLIAIVRSAMADQSSSRPVGQTTLAQMPQCPSVPSQQIHPTLDNTATNPSISSGQTHTQMQPQNHTYQCSIMHHSHNQHLPLVLTKHLQIIFTL